MEALLPSEVKSSHLPLPSMSMADPSLSPKDLQQLADKLRVIYDVAQEPMPVKLMEVAERLTRTAPGPSRKLERY
jgi:hypothetical protein